MLLINGYHIMNKMGKETAYVVFEKGFEYNDEIYHEVDASGGAPKRVTFSKVDASKLVVELNRKFMRGCNIGHYAYDIEELCDPLDLEVLFTKNDWKYDSYNLCIPDEANDNQIDELLKLINLTFFDYQEVELDMISFRDRQIDNTIE